MSRLQLSAFEPVFAVAGHTPAIAIPSAPKIVASAVAQNSSFLIELPTVQKTAPRNDACLYLDNYDSNYDSNQRAKCIHQPISTN